VQTIHFGADELIVPVLRVVMWFEGLEAHRRKRLIFPAHPILVLVWMSLGNLVLGVRLTVTIVKPFGCIEIGLAPKSSFGSEFDLLVCDTL
jgi:hypothetical protein